MMRNIKVLVLLLLVLVGCSQPKEKKVLRLATTTSVNDTGLLDMLSAKLLKEKNIELQWVSVGTGKALTLGKNCDVDIVLTHAPKAEEEVMKTGRLQERTPLMKNYFILVGPSSYKDALVGKDAKVILKEISIQKYPFISRGDDSGTHKKELEIWSLSGIPKEKLLSPWYMETGQGMLQTLLVANEKEGFALTDIATWYKFKDAYPNTRLIPYTHQDEGLVNIYSTLFVNAKECDKVNDALAREFVAWLLSQPVQQYIAEYTLQNEPVFFPLYLDGLPKQ